MTSEVDLSTQARTERAGPRVPLARERAGALPRRPAATRRDGRGGPRWPDALVGAVSALVALAVFSWRVGVPSPWRDEAVTVAVARRSAEEIWRLVQHVDLVHAPFYFLVHSLFGPSTTVVQARWPSVLAAAATAPLLHGLARRLALPAVGPRTARLAGVTAAALWVATPLVSRYAQEARPYALATLVATASAYLLVRGSGSARWGWWAGYAVSLPLLAALNTLALMVLPAHAGWLLLRGAGARRRGALAGGAGALLALPLLVAQSTQQGQVAFLRPPPLRQLGEHVVFALGSPVTVALAAVAVVLAVRWARARALLEVGLLWGAVPVPALWLLSQAHPLWTTRYLVVVTPGTCLLLAAAVTVAAPRRWRARSQVLPAVLPAVVALVLVAATAVAGLRMQLVFRDAELGHAEDLRGTAEHIAEHARPGDGLLFVPDGEYRYRVLTQLYPDAFEGLRDLALAEPAAESATLVGTVVPTGELAGALEGTRRIWVVGGAGPLVTAGEQDRETVRLLQEDYRLAHERHLRAFGVRLYVAQDGPGAVLEAAPGT